MQRSLIAIACALALSGAAVAQQQVGQPPGQNTSQAPGDTFLERVKNAFRSLGEKAKPTTDKAVDKAGDLKDRAADAGGKLKDKAVTAKDSAKDKVDSAGTKGSDTQSMGASPASGSASQPAAGDKQKQ